MTRSVRVVTLNLAAFRVTMPTREDHLMPRFRAFIAVLMVMSGAAAWAAEMTVQVRETTVRAEPKAFGKPLVKLAYGDKVTVLSTQSGWAKVSLAKGAGWVSLSALTGKNVDLKAGERDVSQSASSEEVALATKGFTQEIEDEYKTEKQVDYTWVDKMCAYTVTLDQVSAFAISGGVAGLAGGGK